MTEDDKTFRLQLRLNKVEFADLYADLMQYGEGSPQAGRVRYLLRLGLATAHGGVVHRTALASPSPSSADSAAALRVPSAPPPPPVPSAGDIDAFMSRGFDIANFAFGAQR